MIPTYHGFLLVCHLYLFHGNPIFPTLLVHESLIKDNKNITSVAKAK